VTKLEDLGPNEAVWGVISGTLVRVVNVQWFGSETLELTFTDPSGRVANQLLCRYDELRLEGVEQGRPWRFAYAGSSQCWVMKAGGPVRAELVESTCALGAQCPVPSRRCSPKAQGRPA